MAWDNDRPYLPTDEDGRPQSYASGANPTSRDIGRIYETGGCEVKGKWRTDRFIPFREVRLRLRPTWIRDGRSASGVMWADEDGNGYYMFSNTFSELNEKYHEYTVPIDGYWSAEKRGQNYGVYLVRLAESCDSE